MYVYKGEQSARPCRRRLLSSPPLPPMPVAGWMDGARARATGHLETRGILYRRHAPSPHQWSSPGRRGQRMVQREKIIYIYLYGKKKVYNPKRRVFITRTYIRALSRTHGYIAGPGSSWELKTPTGLVFRRFFGALL